MKLYIYTYASFADELSRTDWTKDDAGKYGAFFAMHKPTGDQIELGVLDIPGDEIQAAICGRDVIVQRAVSAFDAEARAMRVECEVKCMKIEQRKQSLLALEAK